MSDTGRLPAPGPSVNPETKPFWDATAEGRLVLKRCTPCQSTIWYPRAMCPECGSMDTEWFEASGRGTIYSFTINYKGDGPYKAAPYVLAYVELEEGPRVMTNIVGTDPFQVFIGQSVKVVFDPTGEGPALARFQPA